MAHHLKSLNLKQVRGFFIGIAWGVKV